MSGNDWAPRVFAGARLTGPQNDERPRSMTANRKDVRAVRIKRRNDLLVIRYRRHWLLIHLFDYVARTQFARIPVELCHEHTPNPVWQVETPDRVRRQLGDFDRRQR